jgi:hypothetical protein
MQNLIAFVTFFFSEEGLNNYGGRRVEGREVVDLDVVNGCFLRTK